MILSAGKEGAFAERIGAANVKIKLVDVLEDVSVVERENLSVEEMCLFV